MNILFSSTDNQQHISINQQHSAHKASHARWLRLATVIMCSLTALSTTIATQPQAHATENTTGTTSTMTSTTTDSLTSSQFDQFYHYNTPQGFLNDIQSIWKGSDGYYHFMYIQNPLYKHDGDGTVWYHVKTQDFVHYENIGVSIPKFNGVWFSMATGAIISNGQGFFKDLPKTALVAYFTSYIEGVQKQFVAYSTDEGQSFTPYRDSAIMSAPDDHTDFRDPYMFYDSSSKHMMMYLAEGDKIGTYASEDGISFDYVGATILNAGALNGKDLGTVECPNIKTLRDPESGEEKTILFFGANGYQYGTTTGTYYMVGHLDDNNIFIPEQQPQRVDDGSDYYGANFMQSSNTQITSLAWMGNWGYSAKDISDDNGITYKLGSISLARQLTLTGKAGDYSLSSSFVEPTALFEQALTGSATSITGNKNLLNVTRPSAQNAELTFTNVDNTKAVDGHITVKLEQPDSTVTIIYDADSGSYTATRSTSRLTDADAIYEYTKVIAAKGGESSPHSVTLHIVQDQSSVEFTIEGSGKTYTMLRLSTDKQSTINVNTDGQNALSYTLNTISTPDAQNSSTTEPTSNPSSTASTSNTAAKTTNLKGSPTQAEKEATVHVAKQSLKQHTHAAGNMTKKLGNTGSSIAWPLGMSGMLAAVGITILLKVRKASRHGTSRDLLALHSAS
ncbi:MAG: glycoside hydrolase family 32 protein [Bifidobacterium sp.]|jgi:sucrose-6-phosphate hydrolase SacC (GH32 family)|nr:glycoside hydrolase family 32 protein [Bifidobacterium sp.]MCH4174898.1 glycoside hydrolase family 32 protein [Bifidobacterium sp.]